MRLRVFFFDTDRAEYHGQWSDAMMGKMFEPDRYTKMIDLDVESWPSDLDVLNDMFAQTQNDNPAFRGQAWRHVLSKRTLKPCRASCVGDVFVVEDRWYMVDRIGFKQIEPLDTHFVFSEPEDLQ